STGRSKWPGALDGGRTGSMQEYFIIPLPMGTTQSSTDSSWVAGTLTAPCTTTGFINTHFSPACYPATCGVTTFPFHYSAGDQGVVEHEWKNAAGSRRQSQGHPQYEHLIHFTRAAGLNGRPRISQPPRPASIAPCWIPRSSRP